MEAATRTDAPRRLEGDKAQRIIAAMRASVGTRGAAASTFDHVAREAGVSRGLLHYYFGTKERLLVEVVRHDCDVRKAALNEALAQARNADDVIAVLVASLEDVVRNDPGFVTLIFELFVLSRRHDDVAAEFAELLSRLREQVAEVLRADCEVRNQNMDERLAKANGPDEIVDALVVGLEEFLEDDAGGQAVIYEMLSASRHSEEIRAELAELYRQWRERLAGWLRTKESEGVISLQAEPEAVASILFSLGDGFGIQVLSDPDWDRAAAFELGVSTARRMLGASS
jgi:AcrR family transcriptional regulator